MQSVSSVVTTLIFVFGIIAIVAIVAVFTLCMYLERFPKVKHSTEVDLNKNKFKNQTDLDTSDNKK